MMKKVLRVIEIVAMAAGVVWGININKAKKKEIKKEKDFGKKIVSYYFLINRWLKLKQQGWSIETYFNKNGIQSIAIYGFKELGERLYDELKETEIEVKYIIDKNMNTIHADIDVYAPDEDLPRVDAIIVTATYFYDEIEDELCDVVECPIISLEDIFI